MKSPWRRYAPRLVTPTTRALLGEGPVWDERTQTLYFVDIERGELHRCRSDGSQEICIPVGQSIGCVALRQDEPGLIAALERCVALITLDPLEIRSIAELAPLEDGHRSNDGKCDAEGRFWIGTYNTSGTTASAWLYRYAGAGTPQRAAGPYICVNGPAISPDGRTLYSVDSYGRAIYRHGLAVSGELSEPRLFRSFAEPGWGYPDGLTCDAHGCLWVAHWGAARVSRFSPDGVLLEFIEMPVAQPSSCTFGGPDFRQLFVTSAAVGLDAAANANRLAGAVFAVDVEVGGLPAARYRG